MFLNRNLLLDVFDFAFEINDFPIAFIVFVLESAYKVSLEYSLSPHNRPRLIHPTETPERHHIFDVVFFGFSRFLVDWGNEVEALMFLDDFEDGNGLIQELFDTVTARIRRNDGWWVNGRLLIVNWLIFCRIRHLNILKLSII